MTRLLDAWLHRRHRSHGTGAHGGTPLRNNAGSVNGTGGPGGLNGDTRVSAALVKLLERGASGYRWVAATEGSQQAAPLELATGGDPVMAIGGFNSTDPAPTLAEFKAMVATRGPAWSWGGIPGR